jgi:hypothetical protein
VTDNNATINAKFLCAVSDERAASARLSAQLKVARRARSRSRSVIALGVYPEPARHPRRGQFITHVAVRTRHPGAAALASALAFPGFARMILANPAAVVAKGAGGHPSAP